MIHARFDLSYPGFELHAELQVFAHGVTALFGPSGSGKTTFARKFLPEYAKCPNFINADLIAQGLSPFSPRTAAIRAGRLVLEQVHSLAEKNVDFAFETTLSGKSYISFLNELKKRGYSKIPWELNNCSDLKHVP